MVKDKVLKKAALSAIEFVERKSGRGAILDRMDCLYVLRERMDVHGGRVTMSSFDEPLAGLVKAGVLEVAGRQGPRPWLWRRKTGSR